MIIVLYGAMFDEVSEGTAYYKIAESKKDTPANAELLCKSTTSARIRSVLNQGCSTAER